MPPSTPAPSAENHDYDGMPLVPDGSFGFGPGNDTSDVRLLENDTDRVAGTDPCHDTSPCSAPGFDDVMAAQEVVSQVSRLTASVLAPPKLPSYINGDDEEDTFLEALRSGGVERVSRIAEATTPPQSFQGGGYLSQTGEHPAIDLNRPDLDDGE